MGEKFGFAALVGSGSAAAVNELRSLVDAVQGQPGCEVVEIVDLTRGGSASRPAEQERRCSAVVEDLTARYQLRRRSELSAVSDEVAAVVALIGDDDEAEVIDQLIDSGRASLLLYDGRVQPADLHGFAERARAAGAVVAPAMLARRLAAIEAGVRAVMNGDIGLPWGVVAEHFRVAAAAPASALERALLDSLDVIRSVLALEAQTVAAWFHPRSDGAGTRSATDGHAVLSMQYERDVPVSLTAGTMLAPSGSSDRVQLHHYRIMGSEGTLEIDATRPAVTVEAANGRRAMRRFGMSPAAAAVDRFVSALAGRTPCDVSLDDLAATSRIRQAASESAERGVAVSVGGSR